MRRVPTAKLGAYAGLTALGLVASLVFGFPELVVLAVPFALVAGAGLALAETPDPEFSLELERERAIEGEELPLTLRIATAVPIEQLDLRLTMPEGLSLADGENPVALRLPSGERELEYRLSCERWGAYVFGAVRVVAHDRFRVFRYERSLDFQLPLKVYPRPEVIKELLRPLETQVFTGNLVAREKGEGIEFADLREFVPGDRVRRINWRASARRGELWVNELHAERNTDVILFLDSFTEARRENESHARPRRARHGRAASSTTSSTRTAWAWSASAASSTGCCPRPA